MTFRRILRGQTSPSTDRGSLPMALLVVLVGMGLAGLLLPMVLTQSSTTRFDDRRAVTLNAAESGLDTALGLVRASVTLDPDTSQYVGDPRKLPCGPVTGTVDPAAGSSYSATIAYYAADPTGHDEQWLADEQMSCLSGYGVHYSDGSGTGILVPSFVLITSTGSDGRGPQTRTLQATYLVSTTNVNVDGGALPLFPASTSNPTIYCLDVGSGTPAVGTQVLIQPCADEPIPDEQKWSYRSNLTIRLTVTIGDTAMNADGTGLCIQSAGADKTVTLAKCPKDDVDTNGNPVLGDYRQIWGVNDSGHFALSTSSKNGLSGDCLAAPTLGSGKPVQLKACTGSTTDPNQAFNPRPSVGSGQAGPDEPQDGFLVGKQVVNFLQFSRCIDVTNQSTATGDNGGSFLILYPCKQNPQPNSVAWNQKFTEVAVAGGVRWQTNNGSDYCVTSPLTTAAGKYVHVEACDSGKKSSQVWTRFEGYSGTGTDRAPLPSKQRYTLVDSQGFCLAPGPNEDMYNSNLKLVVATCDGSLGQKWNVPPVEQRPTFTNLHESLAVDGD